MATSAASASSDDVVVPPDAMVACAQCTLLNPLGSPECSACGGPLPAVQLDAELAVPGPAGGAAAAAAVAAPKLVVDIVANGLRWRESLQPRTKVGYLKDVVEEKAGVPFADQVLYWLRRSAATGDTRSDRKRKVSKKTKQALSLQRISPGDDDNELRVVADVDPFVTVLVQRAIDPWPHVSAVEDAKIEPWACPKCTLVNETDSFTCSGCSGVREAADVPAALRKIPLSRFSSAESGADIDWDGGGEGGDAGWGDDDDGFGVLEDDEEKKSVAVAAAESAMESVAESVMDLLEGREYRILHRGLVAQLLREELAAVQDVCALNATDALTALLAYGFDQDKLFAEWVRNNAAARATAGIAPDVGVDTAAVLTRVGGECSLCFSDDESAKLLGLRACGHMFCHDCYTSWISAELDKGPAAITTRCPAHKCMAIVPPDTVRALLVDSSAAESSLKLSNLERWIAEAFVAGHKLLRPCPAPGCDNAAITRNVGWPLGVTCVCGHAFCFLCGEVDHRPALCEETRSWLDKLVDSSESIRWIQAKTKRCPGCGSPIDKNGGCNHMTCSRCKHEFCWLCRGDWRGHSSCKKSADVSKEEKASEAALKNVDRYIQYWTHYDNHEKAIKHTKTMCAELERVADEHGPAAVEHLVNAIVSLRNCHQTLQFAVVFEFFVKDSKKKKRPASESRMSSQQIALFEAQRDELATLTDHLHEKTELNDFETLLDAHTVRQIKTMTQAIETYRENVLKAISELRV